MVRFQTWDQSPIHHKFEVTIQTSKNPINLVLSLSLSNCSWNQVECLSCCLSFCRMMVFAYLLTHSLIRSIPVYFTPRCSLSASSSSATKSVYTIQHCLSMISHLWLKHPVYQCKDGLVSQCYLNWPCNWESWASPVYHRRYWCIHSSDCSQKRVLATS